MVFAKSGVFCLAISIQMFFAAGATRIVADIV